MKKQFFAGCGIGMMLAIINMVAVIYMFQMLADKYGYNWKSDVAFFATTVDGRLFKEEKQGYSAKAVSTWLSGVLPKAFWMSPRIYEETLDAAMRNFSYRGWEEFIEALEKRNMLEVVGKNGYSLAAKTEKPPALIKEDILGGVQTWIFDVPLSLNYRRDGVGYSETIQFRLTVQKTDLPSYRRGLKITSVSLTKG